MVSRAETGAARFARSKTVMPANSNLIEVMIHDDELSEDDRRAVAASREYFRQGGEGLSFEHVVAECGFKPKRLSQPTRLR